MTNFRLYISTFAALKAPRNLLHIFAKVLENFVNADSIKSGFKRILSISTSNMTKIHVFRRLTSKKRVKMNILAIFMNL